MNIGVVIVTHNRLDKLKKCLSSYDRQTYMPSFLLVVNNASSDGTKDFLEEWCREKTILSPRIVLHLPSNEGGAGGFEKGIASALKYETEWIWIADDDAYPSEDCMEKIADYYDNRPKEEQQGIVALCSRVNDMEGLSPLHRRRIKKGIFQIREIPVGSGEYSNDVFDVDFFSFVGTAIKTSLIRNIGLPRGDYFIYYDDSEYSLRVKNKGLIKCIPSAIVTHDSLENTITKCSWKYYYMFRNKIYTYQHYFPRRYCLMEDIKTIYMILRNYNTSSSWKQWWCAKRDSRKGILGKSNQYLPSKQETSYEKSSLN